MDRGAWLSTVHRVTNSQTQLKRLSTHVQMSLDGGGSQTCSGYCSRIQREELQGKAMRQDLWACRRMESIHGSKGTTGVNTFISLSSHSVISCPCLPLVKSTRRLRVSKSMETVHKSQSPRTHSTVEKGREREQSGRSEWVLRVKQKGRHLTEIFVVLLVTKHQDKKEGYLSKISIQWAFF